MFLLFKARRYQMQSKKEREGRIKYSAGSCLDGPTARTQPAEKLALAVGAPK